MSTDQVCFAHSHLSPKTGIDISPQESTSHAMPSKTKQRPKDLQRWPRERVTRSTAFRIMSYGISIRKKRAATYKNLMFPPPTPGFRPAVFSTTYLDLRRVEPRCAARIATLRMKTHDTTSHTTFGFASLTGVLGRGNRTGFLFLSFFFIFLFLIFSVPLKASLSTQPAFATP